MSTPYDTRITRRIFTRGYRDKSADWIALDLNEHLIRRCAQVLAVTLCVAVLAQVAHVAARKPPAEQHCVAQSFRLDTRGRKFATCDDASKHSVINKQEPQS